MFTLTAEAFSNVSTTWQWCTFQDTGTVDVHVPIEQLRSVQETLQQVKAGDPFQDITDSDVEDASPEGMLLDDSSDKELDNDDVDI